MTEPSILAEAIRHRARELGFDLVGTAPAEPSAHREAFARWLDDGRGGTMEYLSRRFDERVDPRVYFPAARSIICVAMNYFVPLEDVAPEEAGHHGRIARYALGEDYHEVIKDRLYALADWLRSAAPGVETRCGVDTAPIMERELAARAGIGWIGKNTCVISPRIGSWILLGELLTSLDLPVDEPIADHCGSCRRCIDACPTGAITAPYELDARRCISYLNIEHRGELAAEGAEKLGDWLFGCDVCQEVCPFNGRAPVATDAAVQPRLPTGMLDLRTLETWRVGEPNPILRKSAMKRVKLPILQRNGRIITEALARRAQQDGVPAVAGTPLLT